MKCFAVLAALSLASAAPLAGADAKSEAAPVAVAEGAPVITGDWEPVDAAEVRSIMAGRSATSPLQKRTPGGIYICTGNNWTGTCGYKVQPFNTCIVLTAPYYHNIGSFGPDGGAFCRLTVSAQTCTTHGDAFIQNPGTGNLRAFDAGNGVQDYGDYITSFLCQACSNCP